MERTIFESGNIKVTTSRFVVGGQIYAMRNVTSVRMTEKIPNRGWPIVGALVGLLMLPIGMAEITTYPGTFITGLVILAGSVAIIMKSKPTFHIVLTTSAGESNAFGGPDRSAVEQIVHALSDAIVAHG